MGASDLLSRVRINRADSPITSIPDLRVSKQLGRRFWPGAGSLLAFGAQQGDAMLGF